MALASAPVFAVKGFALARQSPHRRYGHARSRAARLRNVRSCRHMLPAATERGC